MSKPTQHLLRQLYQQRGGFSITKAPSGSIIHRPISSSSSSRLFLIENNNNTPHQTPEKTSLAARTTQIFQNNAAFQKRTMVTVTQTKAGETPPEIEVTTPSSSSPPTPPTPNSNQEEQEVIITPACIAQIKHLAALRSNNSSSSDLYLRVYVDAGGCSGFQYKFNLESNDPSSPSYDTENGGIDPKEDVVFIQEDERVVIDQASLEYLKGSTIDYVQEMIKSSFEVRDNPNSENACGCGSSFAMKKFGQNPALD